MHGDIFIEKTINRSVAANGQQTNDLEYLTTPRLLLFHQ